MHLKLESFDVTVPVMAAKSTEAGRDLVEVCGTAFPIGGRAFLTAGHVVRCATDRKDECEANIAFGGDGRWTAVRCASEVLDSHDVGLLILRDEIDRPKPLRWRVDHLSMLDDVWAAGYPHALEPELAILVVRSFRGHIVSHSLLVELPARPSTYELSFHCPRGLSGAALFSQEMVVGMIVGNRIVSMTVFHEIETLKEQGKERELRREEAMHLGVALEAHALLPLEFQALGGSIDYWLRRHDLLT